MQISTIIVLAKIKPLNNINSVTGLVNIFKWINIIKIKLLTAELKATQLKSL